MVVSTKNDEMASSPPFTASRACIFSKDRVYILAYKKDEEGTRVFRWTKSWDNFYVPFIACGISAITGSNPTIVVLGVDGSVFLAGPNGFEEEHVDKTPAGPPHRGALRDIRTIDNVPYCVGLGRQVYARKTPGRWERFDAGVLEPLGSTAISGFESIDGFSENEIYAAGMTGDFFMCQNHEWQRIATPTNLILTKVLCCSGGTVYVAGQGGMIMRGRYHVWERIDHGVTDDTIRDMAWHAGYLWVSTTKDLFRLESGELRTMQTAQDARQDFRYLNSNDGILWAIGARQIVELSGTLWNMIPPPV